LIDTDATATNDPALWVKNATDTILWAGSSGNVGIGETSPTYKLTVKGDAEANATAFQPLALLFGTYGTSNRNHGLGFAINSNPPSAGIYVSELGGPGANLIFTNAPIYSSPVQVERFKLGITEAVFNDPGNDYDFRVESDTNTHALFVQGSDGNVGIGTSSPTSQVTLDTGSNSTANYFAVNSAGGLRLRIGYSFNVALANDQAAQISANSSGDLQIASRGNANTSAIFYTAASAGPVERLRIDSSGNVGIGTSSPSASAILDAQSTTKGVRMPNMTTTEKNAIASPAAGLMVYDTTLAKLCVYTTAWETITSI
jgi:hypothetical protein